MIFVLPFVSIDLVVVYVIMALRLKDNQVRNSP